MSEGKVVFIENYMKYSIAGRGINLSISVKRFRYTRRFVDTGEELAQCCLTFPVWTG